MTSRWERMRPLSLLKTLAQAIASRFDFPWFPCVKERQK